MNDHVYAEAVKKALLDCINELDSIKTLFLRNPEVDFTRNRIFSFRKLINVMLKIDGGSLQNELMKYFDFSDDTPTKSAYCQQRAKILPDAIQFLFFTCFSACSPRAFPPMRWAAASATACWGPSQRTGISAPRPFRIR